MRRGRKKLQPAFRQENSPIILQRISIASFVGCDLRFENELFVARTVFVRGAQEPCLHVAPLEPEGCHIVATFLSNEDGLQLCWLWQRSVRVTKRKMNDHQFVVCSGQLSLFTWKANRIGWTALLPSSSGVVHSSQRLEPMIIFYCNFSVCTCFKLLIKPDSIGWRPTVVFGGRHSCGRVGARRCNRSLTPD